MRGAGACGLLVITGFAYAVARLIRANVAGAMPHTQELDLEKNSANSYVQFDTDTDVPVEYENGDTWYARAQRWAEKNYMEPRSIERVPEDERHDTSLINVCTMWLSPNMVMGHFAVGILGKAIYGMGVVDSMLVILFANLLGVLPVCFFSCFGPVFGLRQMVLSRFWFDAYGIRLVSASPVSLDWVGLR
ncbi:hypothetical protein PF011_g2246 [Phytophthora fragariae]|uniref:Uncharacterized protein n=1 Tax=Phytophthora fragariae TaxID=53985 RepID=A0A6A3MER9_9STRA|nr:hypothetical protein PF011_g2246 [Phytophthora fragariae]